MTVVKLGPEGAVAFADGRIVRRPTAKVDVVDTTGAGDAFNAGFIYGYLAGYSIEDALDLGNACGSLSVQRSGAWTSQPTIEEAESFISKR